MVCLCATDGSSTSGGSAADDDVVDSTAASSRQQLSDQQSTNRSAASTSAIGNNISKHVSSLLRLLYAYLCRADRVVAVPTSAVSLVGIRTTEPAGAPQDSFCTGVITQKLSSNFRVYLFMR